MNTEHIDRAPAGTGLPPEQRKPRTPQEAARQFEHVLVKQMVQTMTKDMFDNSLAGDDAPQWMGAYADIQGDVLATELARQLTESGRLGIAELLLKQWQRHAPIPEGDGSLPAGTFPVDELHPKTSAGDAADPNNPDARGIHAQNHTQEPL